MIKNILLAADDSPAAFEAAGCAVEFAVATHATLRVVHVVRDHVLTEAVGRVSARSDVERRRTVSAGNVLDRMSRLAADAGVTAETVLLGGDPAACVLREARVWPADLIVIGRPGNTHAGRAATDILEFADQPVLIVPHHSPGQGRCWGNVQRQHPR